MKSSKKKPTVTAIIPAYNEEKNIQKVIKDCFKIKEYNMTVLVIVDKKTTDKTAEFSKKAGAQVVIGKGGGKGSNITSSLKYLKTDYSVQIDADYQFMPYEILQPNQIFPANL